MTATARYERNHIRLGWFHIGLAVFWTVRLGTDFLIAYSRIPRELWIKVMIVALGTVTLHSALAWGAMVKSGLSRKISVFVGAAMFMGAVAWQSFELRLFPVFRVCGPFHADADAMESRSRAASPGSNRFPQDCFDARAAATLVACSGNSGGGRNCSCPVL